MEYYVTEQYVVIQKLFWGYYILDVTNNPIKFALLCGNGYKKVIYLDAYHA